MDVLVVAELLDGGLRKNTLSAVAFAIPEAPPTTTAAFPEISMVLLLSSGAPEAAVTWQP